MFGKNDNSQFDDNDNGFENENNFNTSTKIFSNKGLPGLKSCLKKPMDDVFDIGSTSTLNKSVR